MQATADFLEKRAPTVVEGVLQFKIPVEASDHANMSPDYIKQINLNEKQLATQWIAYSSKTLWKLPQIQRLPRGRPLYQEGGQSPIDINIESFLLTAERMSLIGSEERQVQKEAWAIRRQNDFYTSQDNFALHSNFWPIHYMDYHIAMIQRGLDARLISKESAQIIEEALLKIPLSDISVKTLRDRFVSASSDATIYGRIERQMQSLYIYASGEFINVYDFDSSRSSIANLAARDLYLAPGFETLPLSDIRLVNVKKLLSSNEPEIIVEALMSVVSYGCGVGKGNIIKTHSLFPGEKAVLTIESYSKEASSYALTSSVLDSTSAQAEESLSREASHSSSWNNEGTRASSFSVGIEAKASWGWGSAGGSASSSSSATEASKSAVSNIEKAVRDQSAKVSNNRTVKIDTTSTRTSELTRKESVVRTIENINVSKPLNFVFRQLVQDIASLYTIKDVRIVVRPSITVAGTMAHLEYCPEALKNSLFTPATDKKIIEKYYKKITDTAAALGGDDIITSAGIKAGLIVEDPADKDGVVRWRVNPKIRDRSVRVGDLKTNSELGNLNIDDKEELKFDGILRDARTYNIKTEGVYVDCFLSDTEGLDDYSKKLQNETALEKQRINEKNRELVKILKLAQDLVKSQQKSSDKIETFMKIIVPLLQAMTQPASCDEKHT